jgi:hypothetical protein
MISKERPRRLKAGPMQVRTRFIMGYHCAELRTLGIAFLNFEVRKILFIAENQADAC